MLRKILVLSNCRNLVTPAISRGWGGEGYELVFHDVEGLGQPMPLQNVAGALLDIELDVRQLFHLSEALDAHNVPYVIVTDRVVREAGFFLDGQPANINAIVIAILFQNDDGRRH